MHIKGYMNLKAITNHFLDAFLALPFHKVVITQSVVGDNIRDGKPKLYPAVQPAVRTMLAAKFNLVLNSFIYTEGTTNYYCLSSRAHQAIVARDRFALGRTFVDPPFELFLNLLKGIRPPEPTAIEKRVDAIQILVKPPEPIKVTVKEK